MDLVLRKVWGAPVKKTPCTYSLHHLQKASLGERSTEEEGPGREKGRREVSDCSVVVAGGRFVEAYCSTQF